MTLLHPEELFSLRIFWRKMYLEARNFNVILLLKNHEVIKYDYDL